MTPPYRDTKGTKVGRSGLVEVPSSSPTLARDDESILALNLMGNVITMSLEEATWDKFFNVYLLVNILQNVLLKGKQLNKDNT